MLSGAFVVSGGNSGIGLATARRLAAAGRHVHLLGRDEAKLARAAALIAEDGGRATPHALDLTDDDALGTLCERLASERLGGLVHSAGMVALGPVLELDVARFDAHYRLNLRAPYLLTQRLLPQLLGERGQIVFINSGAGLTANPRWSQYAATKYGLRALADSLRAELQGSGMRVITVYPGPTASPMQASVRAMEGEPYDPARFIQPDDVAEQILSVLTLARTATVTDLVIRPAG